MKIEHTTYDATHKVRARRPSTTAEKIRNFFSKKSDKKDDVPIKHVRFDLPSVTSKQTAKATPSPVNIRQVLAQEEAKFKQQREEPKALKQSMKNAKAGVSRPPRPPRKTSRDNALSGVLGNTPLLSSPENLAGRENISTNVPLYGWTSNTPGVFGESSYQVLGNDKPRNKITKGDTCSNKSKSNKTSITPAVSLPTKCDSRGVYRGRLEHAPNKRLDLQPGHHSPTNRSIPRSKSRSTPRESHSVIKSLNTSADLLDSKRRDLKLAFNKRTETLLSNKQRQELRNDEDSESDASFFCSDDPASMASKKNRLHTEAQYSRCTGDEDRNPSQAKEESKDSCRLCHIRSPAGIRGICIQCENTYCSPQPNVFDDCYEIKPTPPLKILGTTAKGVPETRMSTFTPDSPPPIPPLKENELKMLRVYDVGMKPTVVPASFKNRQSHHAIMGSIEPAIQNRSSKHPISSAALNRYPSQRVAMGRVESRGKGVKPTIKRVRWQAESVRNAYQRPEEKVPQGLDEYGSSNYESSTSSSPKRSNSRHSSEGDQVTLLTGQRKNAGKRKTLQKSDSLYAFYGPLLRDLGVHTPKSENPPRTYDGL